MINWLNGKRSNDRAEINRLKIELQNLRELISKSRSPLLFTEQSDFFTERLLSHPVNVSLNGVSLTEIPPYNIEDRIKVAERIIKSYLKAINDEDKSVLKREGEDLWTGLLRNELPELLSSIENNNPQKLSNFLQNFGSDYVWFGGITTGIDGYNKNINPGHVALTYFDKLVSLCEFVGVIPSTSPEYDNWGNSMGMTPESLCTLLSDKLGFNILPLMGIIHTAGIPIGEHALHYRHINALYSALRVSEAVGGKASICEFGGGLGISAYYMNKIGFSNYTILDLPITNLLCAHYLIHALGGENVTLYGEEHKEGAVRILPYWECLNFNDNAYDIALNQDSFPEIADNLVIEFIKCIKRTTRVGLLSINHEFFHPKTVSSLVDKSGGMQKAYRSKCWVRDGYVDELFYS